MESSLIRGKSDSKGSDSRSSKSPTRRDDEYRDLGRMTVGGPGMISDLSRPMTSDLTLTEQASSEMEQAGGDSHTRSINQSSRNDDNNNNDGSSSDRRRSQLNNKRDHSWFALIFVIPLLWICHVIQTMNQITTFVSLTAFMANILLEFVLFIADFSIVKHSYWTLVIVLIPQLLLCLTIFWSITTLGYETLLLVWFNVFDDPTRYRMRLCNCLPRSWRNRLSFWRLSYGFMFRILAISLTLVLTVWKVSSLSVRLRSIYEPENSSSTETASVNGQQQSSSSVNRYFDDDLSSDKAIFYYTQKYGLITGAICVGIYVLSVFLYNCRHILTHKVRVPNDEQRSALNQLLRRNHGGSRVFTVIKSQIKGALFSSQMDDESEHLNEQDHDSDEQDSIENGVDLEEEEKEEEAEDDSDDPEDESDDDCHKIYYWTTLDFWTGVGHKEFHQQESPLMSDGGGEITYEPIDKSLFGQASATLVSSRRRNQMMSGSLTPDLSQPGRSNRVRFLEPSEFEPAGMASAAVDLEQQQQQRQHPTQPQQIELTDLRTASSAGSSSSSSSSSSNQRSRIIIAEDHSEDADKEDDTEMVYRENIFPETQNERMRLLSETAEWRVLWLTALLLWYGFQIAMSIMVKLPSNLIIWFSFSPLIIYISWIVMKTIPKKDRLYTRLSGGALSRGPLVLKVILVILSILAIMLLINYFIMLGKSALPKEEQSQSQPQNTNHNHHHFLRHHTSYPVCSESFDWFELPPLSSTVVSPHANNPQRRQINRDSRDKPWSILDLAVLSETVYSRKADDIQDLVDVYFGSGVWQLREQQSKSPSFVHMQLMNGMNNKHLIAIRGTASREDLFEDAALFSESLILSGIGLAIDLLKLWPQRLSQEFIQFMDSTKGIFLESWGSRYHDVIESYIHDKIDLSLPNTTVIFTGHSLGGSLAHILAARFIRLNWMNTNEQVTSDQSEVRSFGFNNPGLKWSAKKFKIKIKALNNVATSILTSNDPLSSIDSHSGAVNHIDCDNPLSDKCHSIRNALCELRYSCDGGGGRRRHESAQKREYFRCLCESKEKLEMRECTAIVRNHTGLV